MKGSVIMLLALTGSTLKICYMVQYQPRHLLWLALLLGL